MAAGVAPRGELAAAAGLELRGGGRASERRDAHDPRRSLRRWRRRLRRERGRRSLPARRALGRCARPGRGRGAQRSREEARWDAVPGFWSTIGAHVLKYAAWGDGFDQMHGSSTTAVAHSPRGMAATEGSSAYSRHETDEDYERGQLADRRRSALALAEHRRHPGARRGETRSRAAWPRWAPDGAARPVRGDRRARCVLRRTADVAAHGRGRFSLRASSLPRRARHSARARRDGRDGCGRRAAARGRTRRRTCGVHGRRLPARPGLARAPTRARPCRCRAVAGLIELAPEEAIRLAPECCAVASATPPSGSNGSVRATGRRPSSLRGRVDRSHRRRIARSAASKPVAALEDAAFAERLAQAGHPDPSHRRCPRAYLRPARGPRRAGAVGRPGRVFVGGGAALRGERVPARTPVRLEADDVGRGGDPDQGVRRHDGRRAHGYRRSTARREAWSTTSWSSMPIRLTEPRTSRGRPAPG